VIALKKGSEEPFLTVGPFEERSSAEKALTKLATVMWNDADTLQVIEEDEDES